MGRIQFLVASRGASEFCHTHARQLVISGVKFKTDLVVFRSWEFFQVPVKTELDFLTLVPPGARVKTDLGFLLRGLEFSRLNMFFGSWEVSCQD